MFHSLLFPHAGVVLLVSCLSVYTVHADSHVLRYYFTALKKSGEPIHWYSIVGVMDGLQVAKYKSDTQKVDSQYVWMKDPWEPQMWEKNVNQLAHKYEQTHRNTLQRIQRMFNQSVDVHTYQIKFECVYWEDGSIGGHTEFGYNGRELVFFDKQTLQYFPAVEKAQILTQEWNSDQQTTRADKEFSEEYCIEWINKYRKHVKEELKTNVPPEVKVWGSHRSDRMTRLHCLAYGFHPRPVDVKWVMNGKDHLPSDEMSPILPHPDGTYQIRVTVEVLVSNDTYSCHVEHISLEKTLIVNLNQMDLKGFLDQHHLPISIYQRNRTIGFSLLAFSFLAITLCVCFYFSDYKNMIPQEHMSDTGCSTGVST